jgi:N-acyl-D-aspartate/D-glutamate deacylase
MTYDLVIRGGTVIDGSGNAPFEADVSIMGRASQQWARWKAAVRRRSTPAARS